MLWCVCVCVMYTYKLQMYPLFERKKKSFTSSTVKKKKSRVYWYLDTSASVHCHVGNKLTLKLSCALWLHRFLWSSTSYQLVVKRVRVCVRAYIQCHSIKMVFSFCIYIYISAIHHVFIEIIQRLFFLFFYFCYCAVCQTFRKNDDNSAFRVFKSANVIFQN